MTEAQAGEMLARLAALEGIGQALLQLAVVGMALCLAAMGLWAIRKAGG